AVISGTEPAPDGRRRTCMPGKMTLRPGLGPVTAGLIIAAALLLSGCGGAGPSSSSSGASARGAANGAGRAPGAAAPAGASGTGGPAQRENSGRVTRMARAGRDIVYTASMTVHVTDVGQQAARAAQIAGNAGGYVATEDAALRQGQRSRPT